MMMHDLYPVKIERNTSPPYWEAALWFSMLTLLPLLTVTDASMHGEVPDFCGGKTYYNVK